MSLPSLPPKPRSGEPCNGCGLCCIAQVCPAGQMALGDDAPAPCELLRYGGGRTWCGLVLTEEAAGFEPMIARALGIGSGCSMDDPEPGSAPD